MKKIFGVVAVTVSCVYGMEQPDVYPEARTFFERVGDLCDHGVRREWTGGRNGPMPLVLDFKGRKQFIESVRSENDHINELKITVPIEDLEADIRNIFYLRNENHFSTTYNFLLKINASPKWYLSRFVPIGKGILDHLVLSTVPKKSPLYSGYINQFATNVLRLLKSEKPSLLKVNDAKANEYVLGTSIEIAAMILTTERARDEYSLLISYIEFYKLKHEIARQQARLHYMFYPNIEDVDGRYPSLRFPKVQNQNNWRQSKGGAELIRDTDPDYLHKRFLEMFKFSPYYGKVRQLPEFIRGALKDEFYEGKLEKLKAISENRLPQKSKFKKLVDACDEFYKAKMRKIINRWKNLIQQTEEISEPELTPEMDQGSTLTDPYADVFDEYDENPLNPTMPGHHDFLFRPGYEG